jgi:hypothetical protein
MKYSFTFVILFVLLQIQAQSFLENENEWLLNSKLKHEAYKFDFQTYNDSTFINYRKNINFELAPHLLYASEKNKFHLQNGFQTNFYGNFKYLVSVFFQYNAGYTNAVNSIYESSLQPKSFLFHSISSSNYIYQDIRSRIILNPNKYIEFQVGLDKHKIGEGDRSMLLGNQGISNPFALLKFNFWKLEYINMQQIWRDRRTNHYVPKGNATHFINFKPSKKFSFGIFETVTHLMKDTLYNRGYDVEYLNPLIFYRAQEYSIGSTDNVILGINTHFTLKNTMIYGQFVLDEFFKDSLIQQKRWIHNKFGGQIGFKSLFSLSSHKIFIRSELNFARPYTYSHNKAQLNFANQGLPQAHPLGSNFVEWYNEINFDVKKFNIHFWTSYYLKGNDSIGSITSYGGDIYKDYSKSPINKISGYYIGSGIKTNCLQIALNISRELSKYKWSCFIEPRMIFTRYSSTKINDIYLTFGLKSRLNSENRNY